MAPITIKPLQQRVNISQSVLLFSLFQEPCTITKVIEEIFEVNANEDIKDMYICDFTEDTWPTPTPLNKLAVTSTILTTLLEVCSYAPPSFKQNQPPIEESNSKPKTIAPKSTSLISKTSQSSGNTPFTSTLKRKGPLQIKKPPTYPESYLHHLSCHRHLTRPHPNNHFKKHICIHLLFPSYSPEQFQGYWAPSHKTQERRLYASPSEDLHISTYSLFTFCCIYFDSTFTFCIFYYKIVPQRNLLF